MRVRVSNTSIRIISLDSRAKLNVFRIVREELSMTGQF